MHLNRTFSALTLTTLAALAATAPAFAHPGPHHDLTLPDGLAHLALSADHMALLTVAALCALGAIAARVSWSRVRLATAKARRQQP